MTILAFGDDFVEGGSDDHVVFGSFEFENLRVAFVWGNKRFDDGGGDRKFGRLGGYGG